MILLFLTAMFLNLTPGATGTVQAASQEGERSEAVVNTTTTEAQEELEIKVGSTLTVMNTSMVTAREGASYTSRFVKLLSPGTSILAEAISIDGQWVEFTSKNADGTEVTLYAPLYNPDGTPMFTIENLDEVVPTEPAKDIRVTTSTVNVRKGPGTSFDIEKTLTPGVEVEVISVTEDGWAEVKIASLGTAVSGQLFISQDFLEPVQVPETSVSATEVVSDTAVINTEAHGGEITAEQLRVTAEQQLNAEFWIISMQYENPVAIDKDGLLIGAYVEGSWIPYDAISEDVSDDQLLEHVKKYIPVAEKISTQGTSRRVLSEQNKVIVWVQEGQLVLVTEKLAKQYFDKNLDVSVRDQQAVLTVEDTLLTIRIAQQKFQFITNKWTSVPYTEPGVIVERVIPVKETLEITEAIQVTLKPEYDFGDEVELTPGANEAMTRWWLHAFSLSPIYSKIMGDTEEEVYQYLKDNNWMVDIKLPGQLPRLHPDFPTHDKVQFSPNYVRVSLKDIEIQLIPNTETEKWQELENKKIMLWSGNTVGLSGTALWVNDEGKLVLSAVNNRDADSYYSAGEELNKVRILSLSQRLGMGVLMIRFFTDKDGQAQDEYAYIMHAFNGVRGPFALLLRQHPLLQIKTD